MKQDHNVIPRNATRIVAEELVTSSAGRPGDIWEWFKDDCGYHGRNTRTGKWYAGFAANLRNVNYYRFITVET